MKIILYFIYILFFSFSSYSYGITILLDPGHGGEDFGAKTKVFYSKNKFKYVYEKDLALQISNLIYSKLHNRYSVYRTRSVDRFVSLGDRAKIAEKVNADVFLSIHLNSSKRSSSNGFELYYLDNNHDQAVKRVENIENSDHQNSKRDLGNVDPMVHHILTDLVIKKTVRKSKLLSSFLHKNIQVGVLNKYSIKDRGIKSGMFYVLLLAKRPGILLEVGFLSNPKELHKMTMPKFQNDLVTSIVKGIDQFVKEEYPKLPSFL